MLIFLIYNYITYVHIRTITTVYTHCDCKYLNIHSNSKHALRANVAININTVHVCMHILVHVYVYAHVHICIYMHFYACAHARARVHAYAYICICACARKKHARIRYIIHTRIYIRTSLILGPTPYIYMI